MQAKKRQKKMIPNEENLSFLQQKVVKEIGIGNLTKYVALVKEFWTSIDISERINMMIKITRLAKRDTTHPLYKCLNKMPHNVLKDSLYLKYIGESKKLSKNILIWEIVGKFYGEDTPLEKQAKEKLNIEDLSEMLSGREHISMCMILIPQEISRMVLSYLPRNFDILVNVGGVCKLFYIIVLSSYGSVKATKQNVSSLSVFALNFAKRISVSGLVKSHHFNVWKFLKPEHLRVIDIHSSSKTYSKCALNTINDYVNSRKPGEENPFRNITKLSIGEIGRVTWTSWPLSFCNLSSLFPNLEDVQGMTNIDELNREFTKKEYPKIKSLVMILRPHPYYSSIPNSVTYNAKLPNLKKLSIVNVPPSDFFKKFRIKFYRILFDGISPTVSEIAISFKSITSEHSSYYSNIPPKGDKDRRDFCLKDLLPHQQKEERNKNVPRKLVIRDIPVIPEKKPVRRRYYSSQLTTGNPYSIKLPSVENTLDIHELNIFSCLEREDSYYSVDFNLSNLLKKQFFTINNHIKVFKGELPFVSRIGVVDSCRIVRRVFKLIGFLKKDCVGQYQEFDLLIRARKSIFIDEYIRFQYKKDLRRFRVFLKSPEETEKKSSSSSLLSQDVETRFASFSKKSYDKEFCGILARILNREKRLCRMIFQILLNTSTLKSLSNNVQVFEFGFSDYFRNNARRTDEMATYLEQKVKLKDFVFERDGFCFFREYLK